MSIDLQICGRCYGEFEKTFKPNCKEDPERLRNSGLGMYHCPDCGAMVLAGAPHPWMCKDCIDRKKKGFDFK